jgi:hypothetical protein
VPDANKTLGQDVKKPATDEFERIERFIFKLSVRAVAIAQHDAPALVIAEQPAFAEGRLLDIGGEVTQGGAPASCPLGTTTRSAAWTLETLIGSVAAAMAACKVSERSFQPRPTPGKSQWALR